LQNCIDWGLAGGFLQIGTPLSVAFGGGLCVPDRSLHSLHRFPPDTLPIKNGSISMFTLV
jgi:hypothetical protein